MKVSTNGNIQWQQHYDGMSINETIEKPNGELVSLGMVQNGNNIMLLHTTSTGGFIRCRSLYNFTSNNANHIILTSDQQLAFAGNQTPPGSIKYDALIMKTDPSGPAFCSETPVLLAATPGNFLIGSPESPVSTVVPVFLTNLLYVNSLVFNDSTLCSAVGISETPTTQPVSVYPNPCIDRLNVSINDIQDDMVRFELFDLSMKKILAADVPAAITQATLSVDGVSDGLYLLQASSGGQRIFSDRVVVNRK
jgi:hypothetical protein